MTLFPCYAYGYKYVKWMTKVPSQLVYDPIDPTESARLLRLATYASVTTAVILCGGKLVAWLMTGSVSVLASTVDSMLDILASGVNLLAVRYSLTPPDNEHRFGHGKAESLAGLGQGAFIAGSAVFLSLQAIERLWNPQPLSDTGVGIGVMLFATLATGVLLGIQHYVIKRTHSTAIRADSLHYLTDVLSNLSVIAALILAAIGWPGLDPLFALAVVAYIAYNAWQIAYESVQALMDHELSESEQARICDIAWQPKQVRGVHGLRTRRAGQTCFIQLHLEMDDDLPLVTAHAIADEVRYNLEHTYPGADVIIHQDPSQAVNS
jgi:ferrous-iron efflux pump FieF